MHDHLSLLHILCFLPMKNYQTRLTIPLYVHVDFLLLLLLLFLSVLFFGLDNCLAGAKT